MSLEIFFRKVFAYKNKIVEMVLCTQVKVMY